MKIRWDVIKTVLLVILCDKEGVAGIQSWQRTIRPRFIAIIERANTDEK